MSNLDEAKKFNNSLNAIIELYDEAIDAKTIMLVEETFAELRRRSPVLTGAFRDNWEIIREGEDIIIENDSPYANRLEHGWSDQAPLGIAGPTIAFIESKYGS